jgi:nitrogen fixation protein FixH
MAVREITGKHVLIGFVSAFGLIIVVNVVMAYNAIATFPGLEVKNSYVASQTFDADREAQLALGWDVSADIVGDEVRLAIRDRNGDPVMVSSLAATLGRATHTGEDRDPEFTYIDGVYVAHEDLNPGNWNLRMTAEAEDGTPFRQRIVLFKR